MARSISEVKAALLRDALRASEANRTSGAALRSLIRDELARLIDSRTVYVCRDEEDRLVLAHDILDVVQLAADHEKGGDG